MDSVFEKAFKIVLFVEGVFSDDPDDTGGKTIYGIARNYHPDWFDKVYNAYKAGNIEQAKQLTKEFYYELFWKKCKAPLVENQKLAIMMFALAVNAHPRTAIKRLQRTVNKMLTKMEGDDIPDLLVVDGIFGKNTLKTYRYVKSRTCGTKIFNQYIAEVLYFYTSLGKLSKYRKFLRGWVNRVARILERL